MREIIVFVVMCSYVLTVLPFEAAAARHLPSFESTVTTIRSEDGDIIDCINVYQQPSLKTLSSQNRTFQIFRTGETTDGGSSNKILQRWQKSGSCPKGTIPIRRSHVNGYGKDGADPSCNCNGAIERALGYATVDGPFLGASAQIQSWGLQVEPGEYSMSSVTVSNATNYPGTDNFADIKVADFVRAGWMVNPEIFGDSQTRLFVQWTSDNLGGTGCFNFDCPGFVQTSSEIALGAAIEPLSVYNDPAQQYSLFVNIFKDVYLPRWYVNINSKEFGYWPIELFPNFNTASLVTWGGQIINTWPGGKHSGSQMGSGHRAEEGRGRAAMFSQLTVKDSTGIVYRYIPGLYQDSPGCYDTMSFGDGFDPDLERWFTYGGSGGPDCNNG